MPIHQDGRKCIICYVPAHNGKIKHKPSCPGERKVHINDTTISGGNYKNIVTLHFPCGAEIDCKREKGNPPTLLDLAYAARKHRDGCDECI